MNKAEQAEARLQGCKDADEAAELLPRLTVVQLRNLAKERKIVLPRTVRRKADIIKKIVHDMFHARTKTRKAKSGTLRKWRKAVLPANPLRIRQDRYTLKRKRTSYCVRELRGASHRRSINRTRPP